LEKNHFCLSGLVESSFRFWTAEN